MFIRRIVIMLLVLLLIAAFGLPVQGQEIQGVWTPAERLGPGWFPNIVVDRTDTAHMGWHRANIISGDDLWLYTNRSPYSSVNLPPTDVLYTGCCGNTIRSGLDITQDGFLHVVYRHGLDMNLSSAAADKAHNPQNWTAPDNLPGGFYYMDILVDKNDILHAIGGMVNANLLDDENSEYRYLSPENSPCLNCSETVYWRSVNQGLSWSEPVNLSNTWEGSDLPGLVEGPSGRLYAIWGEGFDQFVNQGEPQDVRFRYSDDSGLSWSDTIILTGNRENAYPIKMNLTEGPDKQILVVWRYDTDIEKSFYYQVSSDDGETWTKPEAVPGIVPELVSNTRFDRYELITDLTGVIHFFAVGYDPVTDFGPALYHMQYRQGRWTPPEIVFYDTSIDRPEWPVADIGPQNDIHLAWFTRKKILGIRADMDDVYVYYSRSSPSLPSREVLEAYPPTPTSVVVAVMPTFAPTATPQPTVAPIDPTVNIRSNNDLYAIQTLLGAIGAVALLCVGILLLRGFRPKFF